MADAKKPNILIIWGDDIGWYNVSAYNLGVMGYKTPNIDRIAREGALFTDWYGQQSCTAGRAAFITGQSPVRTGLTKVGLPGSDLELRRKTPPWPSCSSRSVTSPGNTTATWGIATSSCRPHMDSTSSSGTSTTSTPRRSPRTSTIRRTRSSRRTMARAEGQGRRQGPGHRAADPEANGAIDDEITAGALDFIERANKSGKAWFLWWNSTRMHILDPSQEGISRQDGRGPLSRRHARA